MTISALQSAQLCARIYTDATGWDHYWDYGSVVLAHKVVGDEDTLTYRGSEVLTDWMRDAAAAVPWWDDELGLVPFGFHVGLDDSLAESSQVITRPLTVQGHSLGGIRARMAVAKLLKRGRAVARLCVFGAPKPGTANVGRIFDKVGLNRESFRNRNDPVPLTPPTTILLPWAHTEAWRTFDEAADPNDLEPLRDHHIALYEAGAAKL